MTDSARDYALPIDGNTHHIPCGIGPVLAVELSRGDEDDIAWAYLWVQQDLTTRSPLTTRAFTTRTGRDHWPENAQHIATVRDTTPGAQRSVHVLEVL